MVQSKQKGSIGLSIFAFGLSPYTNSKDDEIATQRAKIFLYGWWEKKLSFYVSITWGKNLKITMKIQDVEAFGIWRLSGWNEENCWIEITGVFGGRVRAS